MYGELFICEKTGEIDKTNITILNMLFINFWIENLFSCLLFIFDNLQYLK